MRFFDELTLSGDTHDHACQNLRRCGKPLRHAGGHCADAACRLDVFIWRRAGEIHRCDLHGRTVAAAARGRQPRAAIAGDLAQSCGRSYP